MNEKRERESDNGEEKMRDYETKHEQRKSDADDLRKKKLKYYIMRKICHYFYSFIQKSLHRRENLVILQLKFFFIIQHLSNN